MSQQVVEHSRSSVAIEAAVFVESPVRNGIDRVIAAAVFILASPLAAVIGAAIWLDDGWPVLFRQTRVGRQGVPFTLFKFRTMVNDTAGSLVTASGDRRITKLGRLLRKFKLDELPQFLNVIRGDMSLVGPRPEVAKYVDLQQRVWQQVLRVRPGITDVATLLYRDEEQILSTFSDPEQGYREKVLPEKLSLNLAYLRVRSTIRDLKLLLLTARYSFIRGGVNAAKVRKLIM